MATNEMQSTAGAGAPPVAKEAPTEQQASQPGVPKRFVEGQTVCNEKNEKGKLCNGHLKQVSPIREEARKHMRGDDLLYKCQTCGALYMGPPLGHVRDPYRQRRFVMDEQNAILLAAGGTLPAFVRTESGALVPTTAPTTHAPAAKPATVTPAAKPAATTPAASPAAKPTVAPPKPSEPEDETPEQKRARKLAEAQARKATAIPIPGASGPPPEGETPEQKIARLQAVVAEAKRRKEAAEAAGSEESVASAVAPRTTPTAATTSGTDSSPSADAHRPAAEAQAATGQASAAPLSAATATASPAAGAETIADLAPEASTELTPGAPRDEAPQAKTPKGAARRAAPTPLDDNGMPLPPPHLAPPPGETHTEKIARLQAVVTEAKRRAGKE